MKLGIRKSFFMLLICSLLLGGTGGCANNQTGVSNSSISDSPNAQGDDASQEMVTVVDDRGIEVTFPKDPQRIVITSITPLPSVYCLYRGGIENLVGISASSMSAAENSYLATLYPEIVNLETGFSDGGEINIEEVLKLEPDVVFYRANDEAEGDMYAQAGIPAVAFSTRNHGNDAIATFAGWIELLDQIFGDGEKTQGIVEYGNEIVAMIEERTAGLAEDEKPTAVILAGYSGNQLTVSGGDIWGGYYIGMAGGTNVAEDISETKDVNMEQMYMWNPEVIYITNFVPYLPEDFYNNSIEGYDWSNIDAVKNGRVYKYPLGTYRWYPPAGDTPLSLVWTAKQMHPDLFADIDMDQMVKDYYKEFYDVELTDEALQEIYNPPREAALG